MSIDKKVADLLGVAPKIYLHRKYKNGRIDKTGKFLISSPVKSDIKGYKTKTGFCYPLWTREKITRAGFLFDDKEVIVYPKFEEANNFVKLLGIVSANLDVLFDYGEVTIFDKDKAYEESQFDSGTIEKSFLDCLVDQISKKCDGLNYIMERAQKEEWGY